VFMHCHSVLSVTVFDCVLTLSLLCQHVSN
jgi:hypothetical protein